VRWSHGDGARRGIGAEGGREGGREGERERKSEREGERERGRAREREGEPVRVIEGALEARRWSSSVCVRERARRPGDGAQGEAAAICVRSRMLVCV
jgi:hypothetical protein